MDSGNSDDQDLDPTSSFLNPSPNLASFTHQNPTFYDLIWSTGLSSDHDQQHNYFANLENSSCGATTSSSRAQSQPSPFQNPSETQGHAIRPDHQTGVIKNPKKRVRASHRAPTTVLKTDAANFRQMVQEFTGFPATSLQGSPYPQRPASFFDTLGPVYPVRPSAHKVLFPSSFPSLPNPTAVDSVGPTTNTVPAVTDYVIAGGGSTPESTNHLSSNQLQDHSNRMDHSATEEMGNSEK